MTQHTKTAARIAGYASSMLVVLEIVSFATPLRAQPATTDALSKQLEAKLQAQADSVIKGTKRPTDTAELKVKYVCTTTCHWETHLVCTTKCAKTFSQ